MNNLQNECEKLKSQNPGHLFTVQGGPVESYVSGEDIDIKHGGTAVIYAECEDGNELNSGTVKYKCKYRKHSDKVCEHTKSRDCTMATTIEPYDVEEDLVEIRTRQEEVKEQKRTAEEERELVAEQIIELTKQLASSQGSSTTKGAIRKQIASLEQQRDKLDRQIETLDEELRALEEAKKEIIADADSEEDSKYRIPHIMRNLEKAYSIVWDGPGQWDNNGQYTRTGSIGNQTSTEGLKSSTVTFNCKVTVKKPVFKLGIRVHRARITMDWSLHGNYKDRHVVETITIPRAPRDASEERKKELQGQTKENIDRAIEKAVEDNEGCVISYEMHTTPETEGDTDPKVIHLLYSSQRLAVAKQVYTRLNIIFADLVAYERLVNHKNTLWNLYWKLLDRFNGTTFREKALTGKRRAIVEGKARWNNNYNSVSRQASTSKTKNKKNEYNDK